MMATMGNPDRRSRGFVPALGLAATAAMWAISYLALMRPGLVAGELLFGVTLLCLLAAGVIAGRFAHASVREGALVGLVSGGLNLLIIGALVGEEGGERIVQALLWGGGALVVSMVLTALGALIGSRSRVGEPRRDWHSLFAAGAAITVFLLLITGGLVTALEAGLAVTDWPNTFGHNMLLYPLENMVGGVYYEHAHRLYGMLVGLTTILLLVSMFIYDDRRWLRGVTAIVLVMVIVQGVLGGMRVTGHPTLSTDAADMQPSTALAIVHGVFGQIVFAMIVAIAAFCSRTWKSGAAPLRDEKAERAQRGSRTLLILFGIQLILGALYRHLNADAPAPVAHSLLTLHIVMAMVVILMAMSVSGRVWGHFEQIPVLRRVSGSLLLLAGLQLLLGTAATVTIFMPRPEGSTPLAEVIFTTVHQANGALLLGLATLQLVWTRRLLQPSPISVSAPEAPA